MRVVAPFVGGASLINRLKGITDEPIETFDAFEFDPTKRAMAEHTLKTQHPKLYANKKAWNIYGDVRDMPAWKKIGREHPGTTLMYGTPSCTTNTLLNSVKRSELEPIPWETKEDVFAQTPESIREYLERRIATAPKDKAGESTDYSGVTFLGMLDGMKHLKGDYAAVTEHGKIGKGAEQAMYASLLADAYGEGHDPTKTMHRFDASQVSPFERIRFYTSNNNGLTPELAAELADLFKAYRKSKYWVSPDDLFAHSGNKDIKKLIDISKQRVRTGPAYQEYALKRGSIPTLTYGDSNALSQGQQKNLASQIGGVIGSAYQIHPMRVFPDKEGEVMLTPKTNSQGIQGFEFKGLSQRAKEIEELARQKRTKSGKGTPKLFFSTKNINPALPIEEPLSFRKVTERDAIIGNGKNPDDYKDFNTTEIRQNIGDSENEIISKAILFTIIHRRVPTMAELASFYNGGYVK